MQEKKRIYSLDLLRIIAMMGIIFGHMQTHGGGKELWDDNIILQGIMYFLTSLAVCSVNIFVMISSYFLALNLFRISHLIKMILQVFFYSWIICALLLISGKEQMFSESMIKSVFPIGFQKYWFATCYVGFYLVSPVLNAAIRSMDRFQHRTCSIIVIVMCCVWSDITEITSPFNVNSGYSIVWFSAIFIIISYIKKYVDVSNIRGGVYC